MVLIKFFPYLSDAEKKKVFDLIGEDINKHIEYNPTKNWKELKI